MIGERLPEDHPLSLDAGWNLVSYLPHGSLPVSQALANIDGLYTAVLGFEGGAVSYYPDLDPSYNTLEWMRPGLGYWISMQQAATLQYSVTYGITRTAVVAGSLSDAYAASPAVLAEGVESLSLQVKPTNTWVNFYGQADGGDGQPLPVGTVVEAVDPDGVTCGAVTIGVEGRYGLLPCYGDDPTTEADEGADAGDSIDLVVEGQVVGRGFWIGHGERQVVPLGGAAPDSFQLYLPLVVRVGALDNGASVPQSPDMPGEGTAAPAPGPTATPMPTATLETLVVPAPVTSATPPTSPLVTPWSTEPSGPERPTPTATPGPWGTPETNSD